RDHGGDRGYPGLRVQQVGPGDLRLTRTTRTARRRPRRTGAKEVWATVSETTEDLEVPSLGDDEAEVSEPAQAEIEAETADTEDPEDPAGALAEFRDALRRAPGEWYVIHSYAGYENRVKQNLETRMSTLNMEEYIF